MTGVKKVCVVKAGSAVVTRKDGRLDFNIIDDLCRQLANLSENGWKPVLVTSGAVASGRGVLSDHIDLKSSSSDWKKIFASVGQSRLLSFYKEALESTPARLHAAQVLVTRDSFSARHQYDSLRAALSRMIDNKILPIINNNDVLFSDRFDFTDNDQLAAYLAGMLGAEMLVLLTDVDGVFTKNPKVYGVEAKRIVTLSAGEKWPDFQFDDNGVSNGGMQSKIKAFGIAASLGIKAAILPGKNENILVEALLRNDRSHGTFLEIPELGRSSNELERWLITGPAPMGTIIVSNLGAEAVRSGRHRSSVLASGLEASFGAFSKGDVVVLRSESFELLGLGVCEFSSAELDQVGREPDTVLVHADRLAAFRTGTALPTEQIAVTSAAMRLRRKYVCTRNKRTFEIRKRNNGFHLSITDSNQVTWALCTEKELGVDPTDWILFSKLRQLEDSRHSVDGSSKPLSVDTDGPK